jgi:hypothetical protein
MKIRLSTSRQLITLVVGMAIMLAISLPKCIADNESDPRIVSGETQNAAINNNQDQGQFLNIGENASRPACRQGSIRKITPVIHRSSSFL